MHQRQRFHFPCIGQLRAGSHGHDGVIGVASHHCGDAGRLTVVGDPVRSDSVDRGHHGRRRIGKSARAGIGHVQRGAGLHGVNQGIQRLIRGIRADDHHSDAGAEDIDRDKVGIIQFGSSHYFGNLRVFRSEQQVIAVGRLFMYILGGDASGCAGPVGVDDGFSAQCVFDIGGNRAGNRVADAACGPHDASLEIFGREIRCGSRCGGISRGRRAACRRCGSGRRCRRAAVSAAGS